MVYELCAMFLCTSFSSSFDSTVRFEIGRQFSENSLLYSVFLLTLFLITFSPRAVNIVKCPSSSFFYLRHFNIDYFTFTFTLHLHQHIHVICSAYCHIVFNCQWVSMMGWAGSGNNFRGLGCVQKFWLGLGFRKWIHVKLCLGLRTCCPHCFYLL